MKKTIIQATLCIPSGIVQSLIGIVLFKLGLIENTIYKTFKERNRYPYGCALFGKQYFKYLE